MKPFTHFTNEPAVKATSFSGKILILILRGLYGFLSFFFGKKWNTPPINFEENPLFYTFKDILYFGHKYYFKPPANHPTELVEYFKNQDLTFPLVDGFKEQSCVTISVGGDLMPYERITKENTLHLWDEVGDWFFSSDIVFANLETPICPSRPPKAVPEVMLSNMLFNGSCELFEIFSGNGKYKGYDILSTANNHSLDQGVEGIKETLDFLKGQNVIAVGTSESRATFKMISKGGIQIAFLAFTYSLNHLELNEDDKEKVNHLRINTEGVDLTEIKQQTLDAKNAGADIVILSAHTGNAYQAFPSQHTVDIFHRIYQVCGVDIILGSHPHNAQPMEKYKFMCPVSGTEKYGFSIYSLADFVAYDIFVWDRFIPLLKIEIVKGLVDNQSITYLKEVKVKCVFNWGKPDGTEIRFVDIKKWEHLKSVPKYFTKKCKNEMFYLNDFCDKNFLPNKSENLLA